MPNHLVSIICVSIQKKHTKTPLKITKHPFFVLNFAKCVFVSFNLWQKGYNCMTPVGGTAYTIM